MALLLLFAIVPIYLLEGWALSTMWSWFVVTAFPGIPPLGIAHAIGISLIVNLLTAKPSQSSSASDKDGLSVVLTAAGTVLLVFGIAWIVHLFIGGAQ